MEKHMTDEAPGQRNCDIPERGWDDEPREWLWYYEDRPDQHCEVLKWEGGEMTLRPIDGSPVFTCKVTFAWPVLDAK
jgi:hypothetical protein